MALTFIFSTRSNRFIILTGLICLAHYAGVTNQASLPPPSIDSPTPPVPSPPSTPPLQPPYTPSLPPLRNFSSILELINSTPSLTFMKITLTASAQSDYFRNPNLTATIFLPTNEAFGKLIASLGGDPSNLFSLIAYQYTLTKALSYHLLRVAVRAVDGVSNGTRSFSTALTSARSANVSFRASASSPSGYEVVAVSSTASITQSDIVAGAAYANLIDTVLQYWFNSVDEAFAANNATLSSFYQALQRANLLPGANATTYTIFAPTNAALATAASVYGTNISDNIDVLQHHLVNEAVYLESDVGEEKSFTTLNTKNVTVRIPSTIRAQMGASTKVITAAFRWPTTANVIDTIQVGVAPNVIIHVVDHVVSPIPPPLRNYSSIWDFVDTTEVLSSVAMALRLTLKWMPFANSSLTGTFFVPTNEAFRKLMISLGIDPNNLYALLPYQDTLTKALNYHFVPNKFSIQELVDRVGSAGGTQFFTTALTSSTSARLGVQVAPYNNSSSAEVTILSTSTSAIIAEADIVAGLANVNIIDNLLQYWFRTLDEAFAANNATLSSFYQALQRANLLPGANATTYTIFAPTNAAIVAAGTGLLSRPDILRHHLVTGKVTVDPINPRSIQVSNVTNNNQSIMVSIPSYTESQAGARTKVNSIAVPGAPAATVLDTLQVGALPNVLIHVIDQVLIPTYISPWQYLSTDRNLTSFTAARRAQSSLVAALNRSDAAVTVLVPENLDTLASAYGVASFANLSDARQLDILRTYIVTRSLSKNALGGYAELDTLAGPNTLRVSSDVNGVVVFHNGVASAKIVPPYDVSILYGRSYVHTVRASSAMRTAQPSLPLLLVVIVVAGMLAALGL